VNELKEIKNIKDKKNVVNLLTVGMTWIDGRAVFKLGSKQSMAWYGVCHYSGKVFAITPYDYEQPKHVVQTDIDIKNNYCEKAYSCLDIKCLLNKFDIGIFLKEFKDLGKDTLGLPYNFGNEPLWFNDDKYKDFWKNLLVGPEGGRIEFSQEKWDGLN